MMVHILHNACAQRLKSKYGNVNGTVYLAVINMRT